MSIIIKSQLIATIKDIDYDRDAINTKFLIKKESDDINILNTNDYNLHLNENIEIIEDNENEPILKNNDHRYVLFPIQYTTAWGLYT